MASPELLSAAAQRLAAGAWLQAALLLGLAIAAMGEHVRAAPILIGAAGMRPNADHPCVEMARLRPPLPRSVVARQFAACLRLTKADDRLRLDFAAFLLDMEQPARAEAILADGPDTAACHHLKGLARAELQQFPAAIDSFRRAVSLAPDAAASWTNLGMMLKVEGLFAEAIAAHDRAVALEPDNHRFRVNRAVALLKMGNWEPAWRDYEARLPMAGGPPIDALRLMPSLRPGDSLVGLTVLALHEEGFGDTLQFLRYLPLVAERGARVVVCVPPALVRIMRMVPGVADVVSDIRHVPAHDFVCPMFSLPRVFGTTIATIPPVPVLAMDEALTQRWAARLPKENLRVGLVWAGQARPSAPGFGTLDRRRSAGLAAFAPLADVPGLTFVSLQAGPAARQKRPPYLVLANPMQDVEDFADTAAIIASLDVVVSVDTSVVHLTGLVGKPVFLIDRYDGCWRWLSDRIDSPWYPGLTIFRQEQPGDWSGAVTRAAESLLAMALFRGFGSPPRGAKEAGVPDLTSEPIAWRQAV
jgi:Flp pilus assembly protein TadD